MANMTVVTTQTARIGVRTLTHEDGRATAAASRSRPRRLRSGSAD